MSVKSAAAAAVRQAGEDAPPGGGRSPHAARPAASPTPPTAPPRPSLALLGGQGATTPPAPPTSPSAGLLGPEAGAVGGGALSSVHTSCISPQVLPAPRDFGADRLQYLSDLERHTAPFRQLRADHHAAQAQTAKKAARAAQAQAAWIGEERHVLDVALAGLTGIAHPEAVAHAARLAAERVRLDGLLAAEHEVIRQAEGLVRWHAARAAGQLERFERQASCGSVRQAQVTCGGCGVTRAVEIGCGHHRICVRCRGKRLARYRKRIAKALRVLMAKNRTWVPKFLTLTIPHSGDVRRDVDALLRTWSSFWPRVEAHLRKDRGITRRVDWLRVVEVSPSGGGHAHLHAVMILPFVHQPLLAHLWAKSMPQSYRDRVPVESVAELLVSERAGLRDDWQREQLRGYLVTRRGPHGRPLREVWKPSIDIRVCSGKGSEVAESIAKEAAKYLVKDAEYDQDGNLVWNAIASARAYEAVEGRRAIATSRGFWKDDAPPPCRDCGASSACRHVEVVRLDRAPSYGCAAIPRGP